MRSKDFDIVYRPGSTQYYITLFHFNKINYWNEIILLEITVTVALKLREGERGTCDKTGLTDILPHYFQTVERLERETAAGYNVG